MHPLTAYISGPVPGGALERRQGELDDSFPKQLYTEVPVMHLLPVKDRAPLTSNVYRCPVYKILSRQGTLSTTGHSTNFVMWSDCPSKPQLNEDGTEPEQFFNHTGQADDQRWIRAGVAAFSSLMFWRTRLQSDHKSTIYPPPTEDEIEF